MIRSRRVFVAVLLIALVGARSSGSPVPLHQPLTGDAGAAITMKRMFIELDGPGVAALRASSLRQRGLAPDPAVQRAYAAQLDTEQRVLLPAVSRLVARVDSRLRVALNGFRVTVRKENIAALRALPGVRRVVPLTLHTAELTGSVPWIGAPALWPQGDGAGVRIAIIDTGIDYTHRNFGGSGDPMDFLLNDPMEIEPGSFPTAKVIAGYDFAGPLYDARDPDAVPEPDPDPIDRHGHGSHVAGIAAGLGAGDRLGSGVAPGAILLALKVFSDEGGSTDLVTDAIEMALDPNGDGALDDRVDIINMSLGSAFGSPDDPSAIAAQNAVDNGVIVVASAGNRADVPYVTGSPAVAAGVISVAASWPGNRRHLAVRIKGDESVDGLHEAREGVSATTLSAQPVQDLLVSASGPVDDGDGSPLPDLSDNRACHPLDNVATVQGHVVLVARGNCSFNIKYRHAQQAGAVAIVVYNDGSSPARMGPQTMSGIDDDIFIPGAMISFPSGEAMAASLNAGTPLLVSLNPGHSVPADPVDDDTLAWFTSRGPGHGGSVFKPDLSAPGYGIVSADAGSGVGAVALNGTSMAAPHVAGAAALLLQAAPGLTPAAIKALLQNSSITAQRNGPGSDTPYELTRQGAGILRVDQAMQLASYTVPAGLSFGRVLAAGPLNRSVSTTLHNRGAGLRYYAVSHVPNQTVPGVEIGCPEDLAVGADDSQTVSITLQADPDAMPYDRADQSQTEVDGWCVFDDGEQTLRVAYLAVVDPVSGLSAHRDTDGWRLGNTGVARGDAEGFMLAAVSPLGPNNAAAIAAFGIRATRYYGIYPGVEFAIALRKPWESPSNLRFDIYVDNDDDGREDYLLSIADWSESGGTSGSLVTTQYPLDDDGLPDLDAGYTDWLFTTADYNDQVMIAPFTLVESAGDVFLEPDDTTFNWRLVATARDGTQSTLNGSVDFATSQDVAMTLDPGETQSLPFAGSPALWLYPNNPVGRQHQVIAAPAD